MTERPTILPPNASKLLRTLDQAAPQWDHLPPALAGGLYGHPDSLAPWLAAEWGISQFARYFNGNTGDLIAAGVPWLLQRGTAAAVRRALGWLGFQGVTIQEDGARLHIDPGQNVTAEQVRAMAHVVRASIPVHVSFYRVFHGLDVRPMVWGRSRWGHAVWSNESGAPIEVDPWGSPISVSQRTVYRFLAPRPPLGSQVMHHVRHSFVAKGANVWRWGRARYGHPLSPRRSRAVIVDRLALQSQATSLGRTVFELRDIYPFIAPAPTAPTQVAVALHFTAYVPAIHSAHPWAGNWDERTWAGKSTFNFTLDPAP